MSTNEAAERLHNRLMAFTVDRRVSRPLVRLLDAALAAERRATVERIKRRVLVSRHRLEYVDIDAILDEEAAR